MQDRWEWLVGALAAVMTLFAGLWSKSVVSARRAGQAEAKMTEHDQKLLDLEMRHREVERHYVTKSEMHDMEVRLLKALQNAEVEWRAWREEDRKEFRALHQRLDRLRVPPSHGNGNGS